MEEKEEKVYFVINHVFFFTLCGQQLNCGQSAGALGFLAHGVWRESKKNVRFAIFLKIIC